MKRLTYSIPLSAIAVLLFVSIAMAQSAPEQGTPNQYGTGQYSVDQNVREFHFHQVTVNINPRGFYPRNLQTEPGTTVKWTNLSNSPQTVTADDGSFDSGVLQPGGSFSVKFDELGTWTYHSETAPTMTGSVIVQEVAPATEPTQPPDETTT